jgi:hypothetical protein
MAYEQIEHLVWVDQHVVTLIDSTIDWNGSWTNDAFGKENGIGVADGVVSLVDFVRAAGNVPILFEIHAAPPGDDDLDDYDGVLEASIRVPSRKLSLENESGSVATVSLPDAADWRLRAYYANGDTARNDYEDGGEHARIVLYPGPSAGIAALKLSNLNGEVARDYSGTRTDAELEAMLAGQNVSHRCLAAVALLRKGKLDSVRAAASKPGAVRRVFASTVWFVGVAAETILGELAKDADPDIRTRAAQSIGFLRAKALRSTLDLLEQDADEAVRRAAQCAIKALEEA